MELNDYEIRQIVSGDLSAAIASYKRTGCSHAEARRVVYAKYRSLNGLPEPAEKFVGYHEDSELPIKPGMVVTIPKGTLIKTIGRPVKPAGRTYKVKVDHILNGTHRYRGHRGDQFDSSNPTIRWAGPGGYWSEADINCIPEAQ